MVRSSPWGTLMQRGTIGRNNMKKSTALILYTLVHLRAVTKANSGCADTECVETTDYESPKFFVNSNEIKTNRPIIGVLTQETDKNVSRFGQHYMSASYVKFLESAGARVAPIFVNSSMEEVEKMFHSLNGAVLPGGHVKLNQTRYTNVGMKLFELAREANAKGDVFPIWGECLGYELIATLISGVNYSKEWSLFTPTDALNVLLAHILPPDYEKSTLLGSAPGYIARYLTKAIGHNNHKWGITPQVLKHNKKLKDYFRIVTTSLDRKGVEFISTLEVASSKANFRVVNCEAVCAHTRKCAMGQYFANLFVNQARLSGHRFANDSEEKAALIYNYTPVYTGDIVRTLQTYFW